MPINIFSKVKTPDCVPALFKKAASLGLGAANARKSVNLIFTDGPGIRSLNRRFLGKDKVTDVIAFNFPPSPAPGATWGEIYICVPAAARQARGMGHSLVTELLVLTMHGALHLSGMDDDIAARRRRMNVKTAALLKRLSAR